MPDNKVLKLSNDVSWVGVLDRELVTFDVVMQTPYGTTYNAYFINAERKTLVETVKEKYFDVFLEKLKTLCDPSELEYIVVNHTEPDHSGSLGRLLKLAPKARVLGSGNAIRYLRDLLGYEFPHQQVKDQEVIDLGNKKLRIIGAPNLHWPDSIYSYLEEDKLLFTCDSFGAHYCHEAMFDDLAGNWDDAFKYYFDVILKPFSKFMIKAIEKIRPLEISAVLPGHGPLLRSDWRKYVGLSEKMAREALSRNTKPMVFIAYVSAYHNTGNLGAKIAEGARQVAGVDVELHDIETMSFDKIEHYIANCSGLIVGSPTINQNILLPVYQLFAAVNPIREKDKLAGSFGSYGWSGESVKMLETNLRNLKFKFFGEGVFTKFTPHEDAFRKAIDYGRSFAECMLSDLKKGE